MDISSLKYALNKLPDSAKLTIWDQVNSQYFEITGMSFNPNISISLIPVTKEEADMK